MDIQPVYGVPALRVDDTYIIADLHIGVEAHLMKKGFHLVSRTEEMFNTIFETSSGCDHIQAGIQGDPRFLRTPHETVR